LAKETSQEPRDDHRLIARIRSGDETAMTELYEHYSRIVYAVALRVLADAAGAEDVLQEVFMQLWRSPQLFDSARGSLAAWLAVVTRHRAIDFLRKRRPTTDVSDLQMFTDAHLDEHVFRHTAMEKVRGVLNSLPQEQRSALDMAFFAGLTHSEIASKTGLPLGTIKTRIRTALMSLRKVMEGE